MAWKKLTENDCHEWNSWQSTPMKGTPGDQVGDLHAASQLSGKGGGGGALM